MFEIFDFVCIDNVEINGDLFKGSKFIDVCLNIGKGIKIGVWYDRWVMKGFNTVISTFKS